MKPINLIIKSDYHVVEPGLKLSGVDTNHHAEIVEEMIAREPLELNLIIDLGDLCDSAVEPQRNLASGTVAAYENARSIIKSGRLGCPRLHIPGNHDDPNLLFEIVGDGWHSREEGVLFYKHERLTFLGLDLLTGIETPGFLSRETFERASKIISDSEAVIILTHFPHLTYGNTFVEKSLRIANSETAAELITNSQGKLRAWFHGHLHNFISSISSGCPVYGCGATSFGFSLDTGAQAPLSVTTGPLGYYLVKISDSDLMVRPRFITPQ